MILTFKKGRAVRISQHFTSAEFDCRCTRPECKITLISNELLLGLEVLRGLTGALFITSGYRCPVHNREEGGALNSYHPKGEAADVKAGRMLPFSVACSAEAIPCFASGGIGVYRTFTHVDVRGYKARWGWQRSC